MSTVTVSVPEQIKEQMDSLTEVNWSEVARKAFLLKIKDFMLIEKIKAKSTLTEEDAIKLGRELNANRKR